MQIILLTVLVAHHPFWEGHVQVNSHTFGGGHHCISGSGISTYEINLRRSHPRVPDDNPRGN